MPNDYRDFLSVDKQTIFDTKLDTMRTLDSVFNRKGDYTMPGNGLEDYLQQHRYVDNETNTVSMSVEDALFSDNEQIKGLANNVVSRSLQNNPRIQHKTDFQIETPYEQAEKYLDKKFGFDPTIPDIEDFYYNNDYMADGFVWRNTKNIGKFAARVVVPAILKFGEGLGYVGSMINPANFGENYWADVADNGFSKWLTEQEEDFKNHIIPVYKQAGFDEKGFFSKLVDWTFWNESVADGLAFMASAAIPAGTLGKLGQLGKLGRFGQAFSATTKAGKLATKFGVGSGMEVSSLMFNTAMEAATEASSVYRDAEEKMKKLRDEGDSRYADLTDDDIRERAGKMASNTFLGNVPVLLFSNAFENTIFFKPFKKVEGRAAVKLDSEFKGVSKALDNLESKSFWKGVSSPLSRTRHYGGQMLTATAMEGYWEENAQLAIERMNSIDEYGNAKSQFSGASGFFQQIGKQTADASTWFGGKGDSEAAESIGLGGIIGILGGAGMSKATGERKALIANTKNAIEQVKLARERLFEVNDIYERDEKGGIVFENNAPKVSPEKLKAKQAAYEAVAEKIAAGTKDEYLNNKPVQYSSKVALADYVRSLNKIGVEGVSERMANLNPESAALFGLDPENINAKASEYVDLAKKFEKASKDVDAIPDGKKPEDETDETFGLNNRARKNGVYRIRTQNEIIGTFLNEERAKLLELQNKERSLSNSTGSDFAIDQLNTLLMKQKQNAEIMKSKDFTEDMSELEQAYHKKKDEELTAEITKLKEQNADALSEATLTDKGYYLPKGMKANKETAQIKKQIISYENTVDKNNYVDGLLSDPKEGYANYKKWKQKLEEKLENAANNTPEGKAEKKIEEIQKKYRLNEGDNFADINRLVAKMVFGSDNKYSAKELELQKNYSELVEEMMKEYEAAVENHREKLLGQRLELMKKEQSKLQASIMEKNRKIGEKKTEIDNLVDDLKRAIATGNAVERERLEKILDKLQEDIYVVQDAIKDWEEQLQRIDDEVAILQQEVEAGNFRGLLSPIEELKQERKWVQERIKKTQGILDKLTEMIEKLIGIIRMLYGKNFKPEYLDKTYTDPVLGANYRARYDEEIVNFFDRINLNRERKGKLIAYLDELNQDLNTIEAKIKAQSDEVQEIIKAVEKDMLNKYVNLTKQPVKETKPDVDEATIGKGLTSDTAEFPLGVNSTNQDDEEVVFDGDGYMRPLHTKFITTTIPAGEYENYPQDVKDFLEFTDNVTSMSKDEVEKKLGKGKMKALVVTRNNYKELGLEEVLADKAEYFAKEGAEETHFEVIPVIEDTDGFMYFVDKNLNKIGKVGEKTSDTSVIRRSLRLPKLSAEETNRYLVKHTQDQIDTAKKIALDWRTKTLEQTKANPKTTIAFSITRGIANKMKLEDGSQAKNPVGKVLLDESEIQGNTVQVFAKPNQVINGEYVTVPVGRPFIHTVNGAHAQLHYADNAKLTPQQVKTVTAVFKAMMADHYEKVNSVITADNFPKAIREMVEKAGGIQNLSAEQKKQVYLAVTNKNNMKGFKLFSANYTKFLSSVVYFGAPRDANGNPVKPHANQIYFKGTKLMFGEKIEVDLTNPAELEREDVQNFLASQFHNIKYFTKPELLNANYNEYYLNDKGELKSRTWKTYSHYLLSEKNPDGSKREVIPVTTAIKTKEQYEAEAKPLPARTYNYRGITLGMEQPPVDKKTTKGEQKKKEEKKKEEEKKEKKSSQGGLMAYLNQNREVLTGEAAPKTEATEEVAEEEDALSEMQSRIIGGLNNNKKRLKNEPAAAKEEEDEKPVAAPKANIQTEPEEEEGEDVNFVPVQEEDDDSYDADLNLVMDNDEDEDEDDAPPPVIEKKKFFRVAEAGPFKTEEDLDAVVAEINRMLPQFPVQRLKEIIRGLDGVEAWGEFKDNVIKLYELAEEGTGYHEVFEAVANRLLTDQEWAAMEKEFKARKGSFTERETGNTIKYSQATSDQVKEELAEEFRAMKLGKAQPKEKNIKFYLKMLWDFIKQLFSKSSDIQNIFNAIDKGRFAQREVRSADRFQNNFRRLPELQVRYKRDLFDGTTTYMFQNILMSPKSLTVLDEMNFTDEELYEPIKKQFEEDVKAYKTLEKTSNKHRNAVAVLQFALDNWKEFVDAHKQSLKKYGIKFVEATTSELENEADLEQKDDQKDNRNRNDYTQDIFSLSAKSSASNSVKFLFGTLLKLSFNKTGAVQTVNKNIVGETDYVENSVFLPNLVNQDEFMLKALDEFKGLSDFNAIEKKLKDLAGISILNGIKNKEAFATALSTMSNEQAVWTSLYMRLFSDRVDTEAALKIKVKLQNYLSKQAPQPFIMLFGGGSSSIVSSVDRAFYEDMQSKIQQGIMSRKGKMFSLDTKTKNYVPSAQFKPMSFNDFVKVGTMKKDGKNVAVSNMAGFIKQIGLGETITPEIYRNLALEDRMKLAQLLFKMREQLLKVDTPALTFRNLNIGNYSKELIDFLNKKLRSKQLTSQYLNADNEAQQIHVLPSFASRVISEMNNVRTLAELKRKFPHLSTFFAEDSILLSKMFDAKGNRTDFQIELGYVEGIKDTDDQSGTKVDKLEFTDRYFLQFQASLQGLYYTIPADSSTEWVFNFGEFVKYSENLLSEQGDEIINTMFLPKLRSEINAVIHNNSDLLQLAQKRKKGDTRTIGQSLRFFEDILQGVMYTKNKSLLDEIYERIEAGQSAEKIITSKKISEKVREGVTAFLNKEVDNTIATLKEQRLFTQSGTNYYMSALNSSFVTKYNDYFAAEDGMTRMTETQFKSLIQYQKINSLLGEWETFKLVFGDPVQYKDFEKRAKSLLGPTEQTFYDTTGEFNKWLNENKNFAELGEEKVALASDDWFNTEFGDHVSERTIDDFEVADVNTVKSLERIKAAYADKYEANNETDGQSVGTLAFARHLFIKSGWRWTDEHERFYQYDTAKMRSELSQLPKDHPHHYDYKGNTALKALDAKIVADYEANPADVKISPVKTLMAYVDPVTGEQRLIKHSVYFQSYTVAKEFEMLDAYVTLMRNKDSMLNFRSTKKIGLQMDAEGKVTSYYSNPFEKNDLNEKGNPKGLVDMRTIGIQVETQGDKVGQTLGSQVTKDINLNLFENGTPTDFMKEESDVEAKKKTWDSLSEERKLEVSANYRKVFGEAGTVSTLEQLKTKSALDKLTELGVRWSYAENGAISYNIEDLSKVKEYIYDELQRLDIDDNTLDAIQLTKDLKAFENPAEVTPSYTTISNLLWAIADKSVNSMKVNGKSYIQVSSAFFNKSKGRGAAYKNEQGEWVEVNSKEEFDRLQAEGKNLVMTSSELAFYTLNEDGTVINPMEIYLPHIYMDRVNEARKTQGLPALTEEALLKYLNENPELLEGIGFRIPTQDTASMDFFKIKGFLPKVFGDAVVVPSALTTKAGSDFDVDKLNTYLNNWKLGKDGMPVYEQYKDNSNSTVEERYNTYVRQNAKDFKQLKADAINPYEEEIKDNKNKVAGLKDTVEEANKEAEKIYEEGLKIFKTLPLGLKQQYWSKESGIKASGIKGVEKVLEYLAYTDEWIKEFSTKGAVEFTVRRKNKQTGKEYNVKERESATSVVPILQELQDNYRKVLEAMDLTKEIVDEYVALKEKKYEENSALMQAFYSRLSATIAKRSGLMSKEEFEKLPMHLQNTRGAVENRYFKALRNVLSSPEMFEMLLNPISTQHIKDNKKAVLDALGKTEDSLGFYSKFLSTEYIADKRNQFAKGKNDIAIFAIAMTNFANSQISGLGIAEIDAVSEYDSFVFNEVNEGMIDLPFEEVKIHTVNGVKFIPISILKDKNGKFTMSKISAYISGAVDVAKEPDIVEMGMHSELAGVYMLLERMGLSGETTALFLYQPAIREFLKELLFRDNKTYFGYSPFLNKKKMVEEILDSYFAGKPYDPDYRFTDEQLKSLITKGEKIRKAKLEGKKLDFTPEEKHAQFIALANFLKLKIYSDHLLKTIMATNHDTSSIRSPHILTKKELQLQEAKEGNLVVQMKNGKVVNGAEAIINTTSIKTDKKLLNTFDSFMSDINLFALRKNNPRTALTAIAARIYSQNPFMSNDEFVAVMKQYEASLIDMVVNKVAIPGFDKDGNEVYNSLYKFAKQYFSVESGSTLYNTFNKLKGDEKHKNLFKTNFFLRNLEFKTDPTLGVHLMDLKVKPTNSDILTKEQVTEGLIELATLDVNKYPEMAQFYKQLVYGAYIQFGIKFSRNSFLNLIPVTLEESVGLMDVTKPALDNIEKQDLSTLDEHVQRTAWFKKGVVPKKNQFSMRFLVPNEKGQFVLENKARWRFGKSKPPSMISQVFFGKRDKNGEMQPYIHPTMIWGGYSDNVVKWENMPDVLIVKAIRPEYLWADTDEYGRVTYRPIKKVYDLMKNGDFKTFTFEQMFKKVGLEDPSYSRSMESKNPKDGKTSILYMYKPINKYGAPQFNEHKPLTKLSDGTTVGIKSMLNNPAFEEYADAHIINNILDPKGVLKAGMNLMQQQVLQGKVSTAKPKFTQDEQAPVASSNVKAKSIPMSAENILKIAEGKKTTTTRREQDAKNIGIPVGQTEVRMIGGTPYNVTNRGPLTITEAGGAAAILKSEGVASEDFLKYQWTKDWINGKGKLYVFDIKPYKAPEEDETDNALNDLDCGGPK